MNEEYEELETLEELEDRSPFDSVWFRLIAIVLVVALIAGAVLVFRHCSATASRDKQQEAIDCEQAIAPLKQQREEVLTQIKELELKLAGGDLSFASVLIMYVQPNDVLIEDSRSIVEEYEYPCLVCCEEGSFPGDENCISVEQARELIGLGWEFGLSLTPEDDVAALCAEMTDRGLPTPAFAYYPLSDFNADDPASEQTLFQHGISTVLQYNFVPEDNEEHLLRYIAAYGFRERNCKSVLRETIANSNALAFTIGYNNAYARYEQQPFISMNNMFQSYVDDETLAVTTIEQALLRQDEFGSTLEEREAGLLAQKAACEQHLAEIDAEITRIYHLYITA